MVSLITVIIAIALAVLVALIAIYYGGNAYQTANAKAIAAGLVNQAAQIKGAADLYANTSNDNETPSLAAFMTNGELKAIPGSGAWKDDTVTNLVSFNQTDATLGPAADNICSDFNAANGMPNTPPSDGSTNTDGVYNVPACSALPSNLPFPVCCQ